MKAPGLLIRADASTGIGTGHVMRMLALAQAWRRRGGRVRFLCCLCPEPLRKRVSVAGFDLAMIEAEPGSAEDLQELLGYIEREPDVRVVLDNYHFDLEYQSTVREASVRSLVVDDYGHRDNYCADVILNQNPSAKAFRLGERVENAQVLCGTKFALLREEFLDVLRPARSGMGIGGKILVTLGGGDPDNVTAKVVEALGLCADEVSEIRVIVGGANPFLPELRALVAELPFDAEVIQDVRNMPEQIAWGDFVVSAAGSTCWELAYLKVPVALVVVADNQRAIAESLHEAGRVVNLGWFESLDVNSIATSLRKIIADDDRRDRLSAGLGALVDGRGADRVAAAVDGRLRITVATAKKGWLVDMLDQFVALLEAGGHVVSVVHEADAIPSGDILFLLSFWSLVSEEVLARNSHNIVIHESALPKGRGWSPLTWQILEGKDKIPIVLFEAESDVDSGEIYLQGEIELSGDELVDELRMHQADGTFQLCRDFVAGYPALVASGRIQSGSPDYYPKRGPEDSRLDPDQSLADQFNLLRVVDNEHYPAFFEREGVRYVLRVSKEPNPTD